MADVTMPKLSDTMEEGKILRWLKQAGDHVEVGDLLVEVETDKADMEVEASAAGVLREVKLGEGASAPVGAVIAVIEAGADGVRNAAPAGAGERDGAAKAAAQNPEAPPAAAVRPSAVATQTGSAPPARSSTAPPGAREPTRKDVAAPARELPPSPGRAGLQVKVSPLARTLAEELGVDVGTVRGTGPAGRVTRRDVEEAQARGITSRPVEPVEPAARRSDGDAPADAPGPARAAGVRRVPLSRMRASIASAWPRANATPRTST